MSPDEWKKGGIEFQNQMECPSYYWGARQEAYRQEEATEILQCLLQLQGLLFLVLQALVDVEYRFLGIDCGSSGSSSNA